MAAEQTGGREAADRGIEQGEVLAIEGPQAARVDGVLVALVVGRDRGEVELRRDHAVDDLDHLVGRLDAQIDGHELVGHVEQVAVAIAVAGVAVAVGFVAGLFEHTGVDTDFGIHVLAVALACSERERGDQREREQGVRAGR